jgi:hypothetical protein
MTILVIVICLLVVALTGLAVVGDLRARWCWVEAVEGRGRIAAVARDQDMLESQLGPA